MAKQETQKESELLKAAYEEILALKELIENHSKEAEETKQKLIDAYKEKVIESETYLQELNKFKSMKPKKEKAFVESEEADDIYLEICVLHERSEAKQVMASQRLGLIPTQLQVVTNQLNICKNNIARALGK